MELCRLNVRLHLRVEWCCIECGKESGNHGRGVMVILGEQDLGVSQESPRLATCDVPGRRRLEAWSASRGTSLRTLNAGATVPAELPSRIAKAKGESRQSLANSAAGSRQTASFPHFHLLEHLSIPHPPSILSPALRLFLFASPAFVSRPPRSIASFPSPKTLAYVSPDPKVSLASPPSCLFCSLQPTFVTANIRSSANIHFTPLDFAPSILQRHFNQRHDVQRRRGAQSPSRDAACS